MASGLIRGRVHAVVGRRRLVTLAFRDRTISGGRERARLLACHRSMWPDPPGRSDMKNSVEPLAEMLGLTSCAGLFTTGPKFRGWPNGAARLARAATGRPPSRRRPPPANARPRRRQRAVYDLTILDIEHSAKLA